MWKWENVPIPPQHVVGMLLALTLNYLLSGFSWSLPVSARSAGGLLVLLGILLIGWSVWVTGGIQVDNPAWLITSGPYAFSRNPMYLAWFLLYLGVSIAASSLWLLASLPIVVLYTHFFDILREEDLLAARFGQEFRAYCRKVPRYCCLI